MRRRLITTLAVTVIAALAIGGLLYARSLGPARNYAAEFDALAASMQPSDQTDTPVNGRDIVAAIATEMGKVEKALTPEDAKRILEMGPLYASSEDDTPESIELANRGLTLYEQAGIFALTPRLTRFTHGTITRTSEDLFSDESAAISRAGGRRIARALAAACARELDRGNPAVAIDRYEEGVALARIHQFHPTILDHLVSIAMGSTMMMPLRRGIERGLLDAASLDRAAAATGLLTDAPPLTTWLEGEGLVALDSTREAIAFKRKRLRRNLETYYDAATLLLESDPASRPIAPTLIEAQNRIDALDKDPSSFDHGRFEPSASARYRGAIDQYIGEIHATRILIALERHRLRTGGYPESLEALIPAELPDLEPRPRPSFPLVYRRTDTAYTLYSVGADGVDNGGTPHPDNTHKALTLDGAGHDFVYR